MIDLGINLFQGSAALGGGGVADFNGTLWGYLNLPIATSQMTIHIDDDYLYVGDFTNSKVYIYDRSSLASVTSISSSNAHDITSNSTHFFVAEAVFSSNTGRVFAYDKSTFLLDFTISSPFGSGEYFGWHLDCNETHVVINALGVLSTQYQGKLAVYNLATSTFDQTLSAPLRSQATAIACNSTHYGWGGHYIPYGSYNGEAYFYDFATNTLQQTITGASTSEYYSYSMAMTDEYALVGSGGANKPAFFYEAPVPLTFIRTSTTNASSVYDSLGTQVTKKYYAVAAIDTVARVFDNESGAQIGPDLSIETGYNRNIGLHAASSRTIFAAVNPANNRVIIYE